MSDEVFPVVKMLLPGALALYAAFYAAREIYLFRRHLKFCRESGGAISVELAVVSAIAVTIASGAIGYSTHQFLGVTNRILEKENHPAAFSDGTRFLLSFTLGCSAFSYGMRTVFSGVRRMINEQCKKDGKPVPFDI